LNFGVRSMIVWDKGTPGMGRGWRSQHELVMWGSKQTPPFDKHMAGHGNVIQAQRTGNDLHTTQKPVDLIVELLGVTEFARVVYDPFAGSGTTLVACEQVGRTAKLCELDLAYCDVICHRYQQLTGVKPTRGGVPHDFLS
jgi:DNA modification methylase